MKQLLPFLMIFTLLHSSTAQITITQNDMPSVNDQYILTFAADFQVDPELTGPGFYWDFSQLTPLFSVGDTFLSISQLPPTFLLFFFTSDLADRNPTAAALEGFGLDRVYTVYTLTSSKLQVDGFAAELLGLPLPVIYSKKDILYQLPLQFGDADSSDAELEFSFPGLFYFSQNRHRVNYVDGWGTVTTPIGTFECLRVKSLITDSDSLFLDTLQYGSNFELQTIEYKWLAAGRGLPVVQVNAQVISGLPVVSQIIYQDTVFHTIGIAEVTEAGPLVVFPNPASHQVTVLLPQRPGTLVVTDVAGRRLLQQQAAGPTRLDLSAWPAGLYLISFTSGQQRWQQQLVLGAR